MFSKLCEQPNLVILSKSPIPQEVQATFLHTSRKESFLQANPYYNALTGFGARATAVRVAPLDLFSFSTRSVHAPTMSQFLTITNPTKFKDITTDAQTTTVYIPGFAVLPPLLASHIYDLKDMTAETILQTFVHTINNWRETRLQETNAQ